MRMPNTDGTVPAKVRPGRREEIVQVAARLFHERGYNGTSVQDIVDEIGLLKGSLYHYINSKQDLLHEIILEAHQGYFENLARCRELDVPAQEQLRAFLEGHVRVAAGNAILAGVYNQDFRSLDPEYRQEIIDKREEYADFLRDLLRRLMADELISQDVDVRISSTVILSVLTAVHRWYDPQGKLSIEDIATQITDYLIRGLGLEGAR